MKNTMTTLALLLLAGCATKEMKSTPFYEGNDVVYTGKPEDRVNVWPVAYWREPVGSVLWPITSFSNDHFALRPIYSQYKQDGKDGSFDEFNFLWPFCQADTKNDDYFVFPFFWGKDSNQHPYQALFPIYWNGHGYNSLGRRHCRRISRKDERSRSELVFPALVLEQQRHVRDDRIWTMEERMGRATAVLVGRVEYERQLERLLPHGVGRGDKARWQIRAMGLSALQQGGVYLPRHKPCIQDASDHEPCRMGKHE